MIKLRAAIVAASNLLLMAAYLFLAWLNKTPITEQVNLFAIALFPLIGAVLLFRQPRNPIGWLTSTLGLSAVCASVLLAYAELDLLWVERDLPFDNLAAMTAMMLWNLVLPCVLMILLLFPDGTLPGPRWKLLVGFTVAITAPLMLFNLILGLTRPDLVLVMELSRAPISPEVTALLRAYDLWDGLIIVAMMLGFVSFFIRFSRSRGVQRQQLKWFVLGLSTIPASLIFNMVAFRLPNFPILVPLSDLLEFISMAAFPILMLIAITRYRLYDIDFIIRRTILYTALTVVLALIYYGMVLVMQSVFAQRLGQQPEIIIVLSTLLIAALFQPMRRRFQRAIDRRFYRSTYDAEQTVQRFSTLLQSEVSIDEISRQFVHVIDENLHPEQVSLWLVKQAPMVDETPSR